MISLIRRLAYLEKHTGWDWTVRVGLLPERAGLLASRIDAQSAELRAGGVFGRCDGPESLWERLRDQRAGFGAPRLLGVAQVHLSISAVLIFYKGVYL